MTRKSELQRRLVALARFLPALEAAGFDPVARHHPGDAAEGDVPWDEQSEAVSSFADTCYQHGWVREDFDWNAWMPSEEAAMLLRDPEAIASADADQLARMLTAVIRRDRFNEGSFIYDFRSGLITRIVRRAAVLAGERST